MCALCNMDGRVDSSDPANRTAGISRPADISQSPQRQSQSAPSSFLVWPCHHCASCISCLSLSSDYCDYIAIVAVMDSATETIYDLVVRISIHPILQISLTLCHCHRHRHGQHPFHRQVVAIMQNR